MRKQSNLNPEVNVIPKPNIRQAYCVICSHENETPQRVDCIDLVCLPCFEKGHRKSHILKSGGKYTPDSVCLNCNTKLDTDRKRYCKDCRPKMNRIRNKLIKRQKSIKN